MGYSKTPQGQNAISTSASHLLLHLTLSVFSQCCCKDPQGKHPTNVSGHGLELHSHYNKQVYTQRQQLTETEIWVGIFPACVCGRQTRKQTEKLKNIGSGPGPPPHPKQGTRFHPR